MNPCGDVLLKMFAMPVLWVKGFLSDSFMESCAVRELPCGEPQEKEKNSELGKVA